MPGEVKTVYSSLWNFNWYFQQRINTSKSPAISPEYWY